MSALAALYHFRYLAALAIAKWVSSCQAEEMVGMLRDRKAVSATVMGILFFVSVAYSGCD
jgi:hypothetical protein